jgi:hypothetical protein
MLDVPVATHGFAAGIATFGIQQNPFPPSSRLGAASRIVFLEASFQVGRPTDWFGNPSFVGFPARRPKRVSRALGAVLATDKFHFVRQRELTAGRGRSNSPSFDHRRRPEALRTAIATAFFCPTRTTSRLPRVTPV